MSQHCTMHHVVRWTNLSSVLLFLITFLFAAPRVLGFDIPIGPEITRSQPGELLWFLPFGYLCTILIEIPVLLLGLSRQIDLKKRLFAGIWLTGCTYPIVVLVLPMLYANRARNDYLLVAETFAPVAECALFLLAFRGRIQMPLGTWIRNLLAIALANLLSFALGEVLVSYVWFT